MSKTLSDAFKLASKDFIIDSRELEAKKYIAKEETLIDPLHLNISMHILHTVPYIFHKVTRRICLTIESCFNHFYHFILIYDNKRRHCGCRGTFA